jgi:hypothetical protein
MKDVLLGMRVGLTRKETGGGSPSQAAVDKLTASYASTFSDLILPTSLFVPNPSSFILHP